MKSAKQTDRIFYFDYLRIFAVFAVIVLHVAAQNFVNTPVNTAEWQTFNIYDSLVRWCVPIFIMISGALFLGRDQKISKIFKKNIARLAVAFVFWSIAYALWSIFATHEITTKTDLAYNLIKGYGHLWFIPMIIGLYMISPILKKIVENRKIAWYFVALSFIFAFLIPQIITIVGYKFNTAANLIGVAADAFELKFVLGYSGYFVLGHLLHTADIKPLIKKVIYISGILGVFFTTAATVFVSIKTNSPVVDFYERLSVNVLMVSVAVFLFGKEHFNKPLKNLKTQRLILFLSQCSFGVYLVHLLVMNVLKVYLHFDTLTINPIISVPVISVIVFIVSYAISAALNKIPVINKYIV